MRTDRLRSYVRSVARSHMTAAKMGSATRVPNTFAMLAIATIGYLGVSRVWDRSITPSAPSRASFGNSTMARKSSPFARNFELESLNGHGGILCVGEDHQLRSTRWRRWERRAQAPSRLATATAEGGAQRP